MNLRTDKYYNEDNVVGSRTKRNDQLYKDISKTELDNFEVRSNATVIGNNKGNNIDVEKIKSILDTHYNDVPKRKSIKIEEPKTEEIPKQAFETKEYDINVIIDKAKENKPESYSEQRSKKLRDTQFDILNNLNIDPNDYIEDYEESTPLDTPKKEETNNDLQKLIDTIALNESDIKKEKIKVEEKETIKIMEVSSDTGPTDPLDIFEELKGGDNTTVLEGLQEKTEKLIEEMSQTTQEPITHNTTQTPVNHDTSSIDKSFFTKTNQFKENDFEEYEEFKDVEKGTSIVVKIIIIILIIIFIVGLGILVKSFF